MFAATPTQYAVFRSAGPGQPWESGGAGLEGQIVNYLAADRLGRVYATAGFEAFSSDDGGASWQIAWRAFSIFEPTVGPIAIHPLDPNVVYIGTCGPFPRRGQTVLRSLDRGSTWTRTADLGFACLKRLALHPTEPRTLLAADREGRVIRSTDGADTWTSVGLESVSDTLFAGSDPVQIFAGERTRVLRSADLGMTWQASGPEFPAPLTSLARHPQGSEWLFAGTAGAGVYQSRDEGDTCLPSTSASRT
ncbi:MAG: WD40/YVTN/BNR-like repeat-containing protein [Thermoanaerobaculia bacterium]